MTPSTDRPVLLGRRTLRALTWLWLATLVLAAAAYVTASDLFLVTAVALLMVASLLLVLAPGAFFVAHTVAHRGAPVPAGLRRSALWSGVAGLVAAFLEWRVSGGFAVAGPVAVVGALVALRAATVGRGEGAPVPASLRHAATTVAGLLALVVAMRVLGLSTGVKSTEYVAALKADLRDLATAEEAFRADSGAYGAREHLLWQPFARDSVVVTVSPDRKGWWATARSSSSLAQCGVWVGVRPPDGMHGAKEGEPACW
ncbi:MAG TPA: hypothetical protein VEH62_07595 [Gemmatimonadales bacterium]|nr:hypothetical protein [Gemmatimonadales bacterium]